MKLSAILLTIAAMIVPALSVDAQTTAAKAFINAPTNIFPLISKMKKMDMVDYFNSGVDRSHDNLLGGLSKITELTPDKITIELTEGGVSTVSISVLPAAGRDTLLLVATNTATPAIDGSLEFYHTNWSPVKNAGALFTEPSLSSWIKPTKNTDNTDLLNAIPFAMAQYSFNPATKTLTLTPTFQDYVPKHEFEKFHSQLYTKLIYKWNGKRMQLSKAE